MTWIGTGDNANAGDSAILYISPHKRSHVILEIGGSSNTPLGEFEHDKIIGLAWGSRVWDKKGRRSLHVIKPTPEAWTELLPHRTAIMFLADISFIITMLHIGPGSRVIEAGTGSGSFSHAILRAVIPHGHLYTFEYHESRAKQAILEFQEHGFLPYVTLEHRDVCADGFGDALDGTANALFLDLPSPWGAVPHALKALDRSQTARVCCFSPNMEQVHKTIDALHNHGFVEIRMFETSSRKAQVQTFKYRNMPISETMMARLNIDSNTLDFKQALSGDEVANDRTHLVPLTSKRMVISPSCPQWYGSSYLSPGSGHTSYLLFAKLLPNV